ncbi:MAG: Transposase IS66 family protein [Chloroflexi bacterium ADurb.Bin180]|nr:MAG: Transposase IS66 family protein [Chloroflexi bacterium ADurb.Bin180]
MKHTTKSLCRQFLPWHFPVVLSLLVLALLGRSVDSQAGWLSCPPQLAGLPATASHPKERPGLCLRARVHSLRRYLADSWPQPALRCLLLMTLQVHSGQGGRAALLCWPWLLWLWQVARAFWPELEREPVWRGGRWVLWQGQRLLIVSCVVMVVHQVWSAGPQEPAVAALNGGLPVALGCQLCGHDESRVEVVRSPDGGYQATLCGHFSVQVGGDHPFRSRLLLLFLRLLDGPSPRQGSRRTRDGRAPFVRQTQVSDWFGLPQPDVSRIEGYWWRGAWPELFGQSTPEILTPELVRRVARVCATFPWWCQDEVYEHLQSQGVALNRRQVRQAMEQSGWTTLRQELRQRYRWTKGSFRFREKWMVEELLRLVHHLQTCLETGQPLPVEEQIALADLQILAREVGVEAPPPAKARPWLWQVEQVLFGQRQEVQDDTVRCPVCGSTHVGPKSRRPRLKRFYDAEGNLQEVPVYRYYCRNQECPRQTFTHMPPGLVPYSPYRLDLHLRALQAYSWSYSTYRRVGQALQVSEMTVYRWVSAWGHELLPVAAIFGLVRSSGVVGVDEKYVLVPKSDKPEGKRRCWMYVYLAVDVHTYDLLHIAIYPHNTQQSAHAFLLALRAKGYRPQVVVTDLRRDYGPVIALVFPKAQHHECLFHAEQEVSRYLRETLGRDYAQQHPVVEEVRAEVVRVFQVQTKQLARSRYEALLARREAVTQAEPVLEWLFEFLAQHWPHLVNSVENDLIPATNNATEMVIRRFDQHYQNFCGFESIQTAQLYLGVFEKVYRFTPFSRDAQARVRGRSPLQLAGYDLSKMPMNWLCRGYCPLKAETRETDHVPNL